MKRQKFIRYAFLSFVLLTSMSCKKFLTVLPVGKTTIPTLFSDMDGIRAALPGAYATTYDYYSAHFYLYPELAGDLLQVDLQTVGEGRANIYNFTNVPEQEAAPSAKIWSDILEALANINNALFYIPQLAKTFPSNANELAIYKGELLFLRALAHFDLTRVYAQPYTYTTDAGHLGIPVLMQTPGPDDVVTRQTVKEVYTAIIKDLKEAEGIFLQRSGVRTPVQRPYFASGEAVQALLSRVYLYMEDWDQVIHYADEVIAKLPLARGNQYTDLFFNLSGSETETIFRLNGLDKGSSLFNTFNFRSLQGILRPALLPAKKLTERYDTQNDLRADSLLLQANVAASSYILTRKFDAIQAPGIENTKQHVHPMVLRVSEVYLNRAEAYIGKQQPARAAEDIKAIRARALGTTVAAISLPESDLAAMTDIVHDERIRELAFEGHRLFDITRRKQDLVRDPQTTSSVKLLAYPSDYFILPIPQRELDANPAMKPNPTVNN